MKKYLILFTTALAMLTTACTKKPVNEINGIPFITLNDTTAIDLSEYAPLIPTLQDYTISVVYKVAKSNHLQGYGHFLFAFSQLAENSAEEGPYMAFRLNEQRFEVSTGGWNHEQYLMMEQAPTPEVWHHMVYRQTGKCGELFIDGELIDTNEEMPILSEIFHEAPAFASMGLAPFKGDKPLVDTQVAEFQLLNYSASGSELNAISKKIAKLSSNE